MSEIGKLTTGILNADKPGWWIVPPWPVGASLHEMVSHFLRFTPRNDASVTEKLAYYQGYLTALRTAPTHELKYHFDWCWYEDLYAYIGRCVTRYQNQRQEQGS